MNIQDKFLLEQTYEYYNKLFSEDKNLVKTEEGQHDTRNSINYALAVLMSSGDTRKATRIIKAVADCQYTNDNEVYYGTFKRVLEESDPPENPITWKDYDPNWREFIGMVLAVILSEYGNILEEDIVELMKQSAYMAVMGSTKRYIADDTPMNSNIELMHIFTTEFYGRLLDNTIMLEQSKMALKQFYDFYKKNNTLCEFNSTTYYGVDFIALSCIKKYSCDTELLSIAEEVYEGLWRNFASLYNVSLNNPSGPYSRCYEMEMTEHSSMGVILYKNFGEVYKELSEFNCESFTNPMIIMSDVQIPTHLRENFIKEQPERLLEFQYTELCEMHPKGNRHFLCTATAFITHDFMMGALKGSQNTSGQLHPGTIFWKYKDELYWIRLSRRRPNESSQEHFTGIYFNGQVDKDRFLCEIDLCEDKEIEVFLEMHGKDIQKSTFESGLWRLPGLEAKGYFDADDVALRNIGDRIEMYALYSRGKNSKMTISIEEFRLTE
jgi:hypothetical protein